MIQGKKQIFLFLLCVVNIFLVFKIFDDQSGLPVYKDLKLKIESVQEKVNDIDLRNRQLSSEIRVLKKNDQCIGAIDQARIVLRRRQWLIYL